MKTKTEFVALLSLACGVSLIACSSEDGSPGEDFVDDGSGGDASSGGSSFEGTGGASSGGNGSGGDGDSGGSGGSGSGGNGMLGSGGTGTTATGGAEPSGGATGTGGIPEATGGIENPGGEPGGSDPATCDDTNDWQASWSQLEEDILTLVNQERAKGANCGGTMFAPTHPLTMDPALRCAARLHSQDMVDRDFFAHDNPSGENPWVRIENAGYEGNASGENIAAGSSTAAGTMDQWMNSPGHCSNIMSSANFIGVGYYPGGDYGHVWTQTFGK